MSHGIPLRVAEVLQKNGNENVFKVACAKLAESRRYPLAINGPTSGDPASGYTQEREHHPLRRWQLVLQR